MKKIIIFFLLVIAVCGGCLQNNQVTGDYLNEAHNSQYIVFTEPGTFTHNNYNNTYGLSKTGNFSVKDDLLTMYYADGQVAEFFINEYELIPVNENKSESLEKLYQNRFEKTLEQ